MRKLETYNCWYWSKSYEDRIVTNGVEYVIRDIAPNQQRFESTVTMGDNFNMNRMDEHSAPHGTPGRVAPRGAP